MPCSVLYVTIAHLNVFLGEMSTLEFCQFFLLLLICMCSLCFLEITPLSDRWYANIFSNQEVVGFLWGTKKFLAWYSLIYLLLLCFCLLLDLCPQLHCCSWVYHAHFTNLHRSVSYTFYKFYEFRFYIQVFNTFWIVLFCFVFNV